MKYIHTLCELGIYVFSNRTLVETGAVDAVWKKKIEPDYQDYMGNVFEKVCKEYLLMRNVQGDLPILFTQIGRWWGTSQKEHTQVEIDLVASEGKDYLFCVCKWRNQLLELAVLKDLRKKSELFANRCKEKWYVLFSESGFTEAVRQEAKLDAHVILVSMEDMLRE